MRGDTPFYWTPLIVGIAYLAGAGAGAVAGLLLGRAGFEVDALGVAGTVAAAGLLLALTPQVSELEDGRTYALTLGAVALVNLVLAAQAERG